LVLCTANVGGTVGEALGATCAAAHRGVKANAVVTAARSNLPAAIGSPSGDENAVERSCAALWVACEDWILGARVLLHCAVTCLLF
jgi:hypothetical protein